MADRIKIRAQLDHLQLLLADVERIGIPDRWLDAQIACWLPNDEYYAACENRPSAGKIGCVITRYPSGKTGTWVSSRVTSSLDAAIDLVDRLLPDFNYILAKGKVTASEPRYGIQILSGLDVIAEVEHEHREIAIIQALLRALIAKAEAHG